MNAILAWCQILCAATVGKFAGLSDVPVPPEPVSNCTNHIVENHVLGPWESTQWLRAPLEISIPKKYIGSRNPRGDVSITHISWQTFWHIVCHFSDTFSDLVPTLGSLIMLWRFHWYKFKHAVLGRFKHSIQHSDDKIVQILCYVYLGILLATFCELCKYSKPGKPAI